MPSPKIHPSSIGEPMHYSIGAVIEKDGLYLLLDRIEQPLGFACPAGHVYEWENKEDALKREIFEETGMELLSQTLLLEEEIPDNRCSQGIYVHHWYVFKCETKGNSERNVERAQSIDWFHPKDIKKLNLEPMWKYWFKKLKII